MQYTRSSYHFQTQPQKQTRHNYFVKLAKSDFRIFFLRILQRLDDVIVQDNVAEAMCSNSSYEIWSEKPDGFGILLEVSRFYIPKPIYA